MTEVIPSILVKTHEEFVDRLRLVEPFVERVHLDIAGTGRSEVDAGENVKGGTGFGVRLLIEWLGSF